MYSKTHVFTGRIKKELADSCLIIRTNLPFVEGKSSIFISHIFQYQLRLWLLLSVNKKIKLKSLKYFDNKLQK